MNHNGMSIINECMSHETHGGVTKWGWRNKGMNRLQANINPISIGYVKNKISLIKERSI